MRGLFLKDNNKCVSSHLFHINCHQVVDLVSYFHFCPLLLPPIYQSMRLLFRWLSKSCQMFCLLFGESEDYLAAGCCCRLNGKNLQMFGVNLCIVSPLGAVLVHNLEGRGILSCEHNHPELRDGSEIAKTEIRCHFQRGRRGSSGLIGTSEGRRGIEV